MTAPENRIPFQRCKEFRNLQTTNQQRFGIIRNDENVILIDVRSRQEFLEGHLNGSINIPLYELEQCCERKLIDKNSIIITYCQCGARSKKAIVILKKHGYKNVYHLKDGLDSI